MLGLSRFWHRLVSAKRGPALCRFSSRSPYRAPEEGHLVFSAPPQPQEVDSASIFGRRGRTGEGLPRAPVHSVTSTSLPVNGRDMDKRTLSVVQSVQRFLDEVVQEESQHRPARRAASAPSWPSTSVRTRRPSRSSAWTSTRISSSTSTSRWPPSSRSTGAARWSASAAATCGTTRPSATSSQRTGPWNRFRVGAVDRSASRPGRRRTGMRSRSASTCSGTGGSPSPSSSVAPTCSSADGRGSRWSPRRSWRGRCWPTSGASWSSGASSGGSCCRSGSARRPTARRWGASRSWSGP